MTAMDPKTTLMASRSFPGGAILDNLAVSPDLKERYLKNIYNFIVLHTLMSFYSNIMPFAPVGMIHSLSTSE